MGTYSLAAQADFKYISDEKSILLLYFQSTKLVCLPYFKWILLHYTQFGRIHSQLTIYNSSFKNWSLKGLQIETLYTYFIDFLSISIANIQQTIWNKPVIRKLFGIGLGIIIIPI